ncbi:hypothetical protein [Candidatus Chloroploca asiatica]|uniref:GHMP kinase N-terminal domain-containing protein n=1 Tax=Candidatus Chloroploca asiatica TaxID=1506545 RepID=A0A2H3KQK5_9CHLR|nr:hypothetical protein [Candidatus Chloroploca asiatica]PDV99771.1 hypothetical protein A9Q02_00720 [Candidatus Chloroploca asiatica]
MPHEFERFLQVVRAERDFFGHTEGSIYASRGPGWVDLVGGAAFDGGTLALGWPLGTGTFVAVQPQSEPVIEIRILPDPHATGEVHPRSGQRQRDKNRTPLADVASYRVQCHQLATLDGTPSSYGEGRKVLSEFPAMVQIVGGIWLALMREEFVRFPGGVRVLVQPNSGPGATMGLGAAIAQALVAAFQVQLAPRELGLLVQTALHRSSGTNPGVLGPLVSVCSHAGSLLLVHQQPAWLWGELHLPPGTALWAVAIGDGPPIEPQHQLQVATAMAYHLVAEVTATAPNDANSYWRGYLSNLGTARYEARVRATLPVSLSGAAFLERADVPAGISIDPAVSYPVRAAAALAVEEHLRARMIAALLRAAASKAQRDEDLHLVGELLARSHGGQRAAGLGDPRADRLVEVIALDGGSLGLYGARATAAASGASLVVLGHNDAEAALQTLVDKVVQESGLHMRITGGTSSGAHASGVREV